MDKLDIGSPLGREQRTLPQELQFENLAVSESGLSAHTTSRPDGISRWSPPSNPNPERFLDEAIEIPQKIGGNNLLVHFDPESNEIILFYPKVTGPSNAQNLKVYSSQKVSWHDFSNLSPDAARAFCNRYYGVINPLHMCGRMYAPVGHYTDEVGILAWNPGEHVPDKVRDQIGATTTSPSRRYAWRHREKHNVREARESIKEASKTWRNNEIATPAPYNPEIHIEYSVELSKTTDRRLGYDPVNREIIIFDLDENYNVGNVEIPKYHGHVRELDSSTLGEVKEGKCFAKDLKIILKMIPVEERE